MATVNLRKGSKVSLNKMVPGLKKVTLGLGWDTNQYDGSYDFDLDASAFLVDSTGRCANSEDFIFYNNVKHPSGAVLHTGDNRTGEGDGDDESIIIDFERIPSHIIKIAITVTIHDAEVRGQNFGQVSNAFIRMVDMNTDNEILRYDLGEKFSEETALVFGELYSYEGEWKFNAIGSGFNGGLEALCRTYNLDVE